MMPEAAVEAVGHGKHGSDGERGRDGVDVEITMGLLSFGDLEIDVGGGDGGNGTKGGDGGAGSRGSCSDICKGGPGGNGGRGGQAGAGGNGGNISIAYWIVSLGRVAGPVEGQNLIAFVKGGSGGRPGDGGKAGRGGAGTGNCGIWPYFRRGSGTSGHRGAKGTEALPGLNGSISIAPLTYSQ